MFQLLYTVNGIGVYLSGNLCKNAPVKKCNTFSGSSNRAGGGSVKAPECNQTPQVAAIPRVAIY